MYEMKHWEMRRGKVGVQNDTHILPFTWGGLRAWIIRRSLEVSEWFHCFQMICTNDHSLLNILCIICIFLEINNLYIVLWKMGIGGLSTYNLYLSIFNVTSESLSTEHLPYKSQASNLSKQANALRLLKI